MAAIGETRAQALIATAEKVGLTADQIAAHVRSHPDRLDSISGAAERRIGELIEGQRVRHALIERFVDQCTRHYGKTEAEVRALAGKAPVHKLEQAVDANLRDMRRRGIDTRTLAEQRADAERREADRRAAALAPATHRQVEYLMDLLARRARTGDGGGFMSSDEFYTADGRQINRAALEALTRPQASNLIDSLTNNY